MYIIDEVSNGFFLADIIINFFTAYDNLETELPEIKLKRIAKNYLTGWFTLDFVAILPIQ